MVPTTILFGSHVLLRRLFLFIGSSTLLFFTHEYIKPRLPVYTIQINLSPMVHFVKSSITRQWQTILSTKIQFYNENYLHLSIHAMTFDAYIERYENTAADAAAVVVVNNNDDAHHTVASVATPTSITSTASLLHIATITDQNQHQTRSIESSSNRQGDVVVSNHHDDALWSIPGRTNFTIQHCPLYMTFSDPWTTNTSTMTYIRSILLVTYNLISYTIQKLWQNKYNGRIPTTFTIPTTGVAHIRASMLPNNRRKSSNDTLIAAMPFTVGMICNNEINILQLQIVGVQCQQYLMIPGWAEPISSVAAKLRNYAVTKLLIQNTTTGSVLL